MQITYAEMAQCLHLSLSAKLPPAWLQTTVKQVATDSREVRQDSLFVCIVGNRVDGHTFALQAEQDGAKIILAEHDLPDVHVPVLVVPDTVKALGQLATWQRSKTRATVIGVTGTCGKTTVKESLAQVLSLQGRTAKNKLNQNTQIGMPCSLLNADGNEDFWVFEIGISHDGDMEDLGAILKPDLALILNVGAGHTEGLGEKGVAWHKTRLLKYLNQNGYGLVSADYPDLVHETLALQQPAHFFSASCPPSALARYTATYLGSDTQTGLGKYQLHLDGQDCVIEAPFHSAYGAENCLAVATCAQFLGLNCQQIAQGLRKIVLPPQRFKRLLLSNLDILDDTYNANPLSMRRMLEAAKELAGERNLIAVLGEMGELGEFSAQLHEELGHFLASVQPLAVFWKGGHADDVRRGLTQARYQGAWLQVNTPAEFLALWSDLQHSSQGQSIAGAVVLFKGSRMNKMEELLNELSAII